jgi:adenosylhomocysteinase
VSAIADPALAAAGEDRIAWADAQMPVLRLVRERFAAERPLDGVTVAACLHVTAETANLVRALVAGGARTALSAANPLSTQDDVAAALAESDGAEVHAVRGEDAAAYADHVRTLVGLGPDITLDDGADLVAAVHELDPGHAEAMLGAMEETTTGMLRVRRMAAEGRLRCPVLAVNECWAERTLNDRFGTGQSVLDGILRATNLLLAGRVVVVLGYGWTGRGVALRARGAGASVVVCEIDPMRALEARMEGFEVLPSLVAAGRGDVFITVTGSTGVLGAPHFARMKDGAVLANAGHFDVEIDLDALAAAATDGVRQVLPLVETYVLGGRRLHLLARGRVVNLAAALGHPAEVMDVPFATHALCVEALVRAGRGDGAGRLAAGVHAVPEGIDREVARLKLAALGVALDEPTPEQDAYRSSWAQGG